LGNENLKATLSAGCRLPDARAAAPIAAPGITVLVIEGVTIGVVANDAEEEEEDVISLDFAMFVVAMSWFSA